MVPPSIHPSGKRYRYSTQSPSRIAPLPKNLSKLRPKRTHQRQERSQTGTTDLVIKSGGRNDFFFRTACFLRRRFDDEDAVEAMLEALNDDFTEAPLSPSELRSVIHSSGNYVEDTTALFGPPKTTEPLPMEFLYYPYIPYFGVTLLAGNPGMGKSLLVTKLIAAVTSGGPWPLSDECAPKGKVLMLSAEDNWQRVTLPKLLESGADISKIRVMTRFKILSPENLEAMARYIEQERPKLVVIDTLTAYMGSGRDMNRQNEVGEFLGRLTEIAEDAGCAVLAIGHLNKQSAEHPLYRIVGSIGFAASIRSALFYGTDPTDRSRFRAMGRMVRSTVLLSSSMRPSSRNRQRPSQYLAMYFSASPVGDLAETRARLWASQSSRVSMIGFEHSCRAAWRWSAIRPRRSFSMR